MYEISQVAESANTQDFIAMHVHDSISYKRCRRKWYYSSAFRKHLQAKGSENINLWFGTGIHFALEDWYGYRRFEHPGDAFFAFYEATKNKEIEDMDKMLDLAMGMLNHLLLWEKKRPYYKTLMLDGVPQVEVDVALELSELSEISDMPIYYYGTLDRVVVDDYGDWWVMDYKTAQNYDAFKATMDPQTTKYVWAAEQWYQHEIKGVIILQLMKKNPKYPSRLVRGGFSKAKNQSTTYALYKEALINEYGEVPSEYDGMLEYLSSKEDLMGNDFLKFLSSERNTAEKENIYRHMLAEGQEMLNPDLPIYPNPTRDCSWDCPFRPVCMLEEGGFDVEPVLREEYEVRTETAKGIERAWRSAIKYPTDSTPRMSLEDMMLMEGYKIVRKEEES